MDQYDEVMKPKSKQDKTRNDTNEVMKSKSKQVIARNNTNDFRGTLSDATKFLLALNKTSPQFNSTGSYTLPSMNQFKSYGGDATPIEEPLAGKTAKSDKQMKPNRFGIYLPDNPAEIFAKATAGQSSSGGFFNSLAAKIGSLPKALIGDNRGLRVISGEPAGDVHESEP